MIMDNCDDKPIYVTCPFIPPKEDFIRYIDQIWDSKVLTNNGPLTLELQNKLAQLWNVPFVNLFNNCTNALMASFPILGVESGEVITTPYTFIATAHSIVWNNLKPIFVDIDPKTFNISPEAIENAVTDKTKAILAVHCYGRPCDTVKIEKIARKYNLKVIYDAAHAFNVCDEGGSILRYGDLSVLSFHATKVLNTFEGGAIISHSQEMFDRIFRFQNFGIVSEEQIEAIGMNGKQSEIHAAMGLACLPYVESAIEKRKWVYDQYHEHLVGLPLKLPNYSDIKKPNYSYFPVLVNENAPISRDTLVSRMNEKGIFPRKYFYPEITKFDVYADMFRECSIAQDTANRVLCLPIYPSMSEQDMERIVLSIRDCF